MSEPEKRLRQHPTERFDGTSHVLDLNAALRQLRAEIHASQHGHRQVTIFHRAPVTKVLFDFEAGGELADHAARGLVTIHVLEGRLLVTVGEAMHDLAAGMMVVLAPDVRHSVRAQEPGAMLLTVHLERDK